jgi:hypothetical protein
MGYANSPIRYANPDAVTQIANGLSTTTYAYDNNGNLISSGNGTATTTYTYDYATASLPWLASWRRMASGHGGRWPPRFFLALLNYGSALYRSGGWHAKSTFWHRKTRHAGVPACGFVIPRT